MIKVMEQRSDKQVSHLARSEPVLIVAACLVTQPQHMQQVSKIVVGIIDIARLKEQYAKIKRQISFIETLLIRDDFGKIARHFRERHGSLAVRHRRICKSARAGA